MLTSNEMHMLKQLAMLFSKNSYLWYFSSFCIFPISYNRLESVL